MTLERLTKHWHKNNLSDGAIVFFQLKYCRNTLNEGSVTQTSDRDIRSVKAECSPQR